MKQLLTVVCAVVLVVLSTQARAERVTAGLKAGGNFGDFAGDDPPEHLSGRSAFQGGGFVQCPINERLSVRGNVLYVQKGAEGDIVVEDGDTHTGLYKLDYIDIPVEFVASFPAGNTKFGYTVFAGPSFNFNMKAEAAVEEHGTVDLEGVRSFEFGAVVGMGVTYALEKFSLLAEGRYSMSVTSSFDDADIKNRGVGVLGGLVFPIGAEK
jgi:hypothetical protein